MADSRKQQFAQVPGSEESSWFTPAADRAEALPDGDPKAGESGVFEGKPTLESIHFDSVHEAALHFLPDAVILVGADARVEFVNRALLELLDSSHKDFVGRPIFDVFSTFHEVSGQSVDSPVHRVVRGVVVGSDSEIVLLKRPDGAMIPVDVRAAPLSTPSGVVSHVIVTIRDKSAKRALEDHQRRSEERLRQTQKMEAIGRLSGGVAHDFNNLLTVIGSSVEALLESPELPQDGREIVFEIENAASRAAELTRQLLSLGRRNILEPRIFDLNVHLREMENALRRILGEAIDLVLDLDPELRPVKADPNQVELAIQNLCLNARDAMIGGGRFTLRTDAATNHPELSVPGGEEIPYSLLVVSDTGVGMSHDVASRAFEPFFTTKQKGRGAGLGLSTVHGIVSQAGGHLELESRLGQGTSVRLYLPAALEPVSTQRKVREGGADAGGTILLVDDEDGIRLVASSTLRRQGFSVLTARDGAEAFELFRAHADEIDLVVTDVVMPNMGGRELSERIRRANPHIPLLFISGYTDDTLVRHGIEEGVTNFLQKPFTGSVLAKKVREVLGSGARAHR